MALAFVREIHRRPVDFPHQGPVNAENVSIWWRHHVQSAGTHVVLVASCPLYRVSLVAVMGWLAVESLQHRNSGNVLLNKANLRDLIAVTGLEILHKVDSNRRFLARVTWTFDEWPRKTLGHLSCTNSNRSYSPETLNSGQNRWFFRPVWPWIWQMTLKNNKAPLLCHIKLGSSFHRHMWIQTGVTAQKHPIRVKIGNFLSRVTLKIDGWLEKQ